MYMTFRYLGCTLAIIQSEKGKKKMGKYAYNSV